MILANRHTDQNSTPFLKHYLLWGVGLFASIVIAGLVWSSLSKPKASENLRIQCDAEQIEKGNFVSGKYTFTGGHTRNDSIAQSGKFSSKVDKKNMYGLGYELPQPQKGDQYKASIWRYAPTGHPSFLVVSAEKTADFYIQEGKSIEKKSSGWELVQIIFNIPQDKDLNLLKIYTYSRINANQTVFFDDLSIEKMTDSSTPIDTTNLLVNQVMDLKIGEKGMNKLQDKRTTAFNNGILITEDKDWVKAQIGGNEQDIPVKLRLKGDWLDHLQGEKWSFRIKAKDPHAWNRLITFSIQSPHTRLFLREWFYHKFLEQEDVLSPRYGFIKVRLNGKDLGVYAYEEHFDKQLPEFKQRREGPIVKMTEDALWASHKKQHDHLGGIGFPDYSEISYLASEVRPFKEGKTLKSPALSKQFDIAQNLMYQYRFDLKSASDIFDIDRLAKYYAIMDICQAYHGFTWHNQRFYYNPVISKLEPIGFDGYGEHITKFRRGPFIGYYHNPNGHISEVYRNLLKDDAFYGKYIQYLYQFSAPEYIQNLLANFENELLQWQQFIQEEYPEYYFKKDEIVERARKIHALVFPIPEAALKAYRQARTANKATFKVHNLHSLPLEIIGFGESTKNILTRPNEPITIRSQLRDGLPKYYDIDAPSNTKVMFYKLLGMDSLFHTSVIDWQIPSNEIPVQSLDPNVLKPHGAFQVNDQKITFKVGEHFVSEDIIIPKGFEVHFKAGTKINFTNKAKFISYSPVFMYGIAEKPIHISSNDQTANGFTVLQAAEKSTLHHVIFDNLNTLQYQGWTLTGAVNFYESDVQLDHCSFINNHCEDALNIIRSEFEMNQCLVQNTFADGFDCDFCKGNITHSRFVKTGNDAMDFSGSVITVKNTTVEQAGDKGISVGEEATVFIQQLNIEGAQIGLASKDFSKLKADDIQLKDCYHGFAAYQKKPEYGSATIIVNKYATENIKHLYLIEPGSSLKLDDKVIKGE